VEGVGVCIFGTCKEGKLRTAHIKKAAIFT